MKNLYLTIAKAFNTLDCTVIESISAEAITLSINHEIEIIKGKRKVIKYLKTKFEKIKTKKTKRYAELAYMGDQHGHRQQFLNLHKGVPCLIFAKGPLKPHGAILVVEVNNMKKVKEICVCTLVREWSAVIGTGIYSGVIQLYDVPISPIQSDSHHYLE